MLKPAQAAALLFLATMQTSVHPGTWEIQKVAAAEDRQEEKRKKQLEKEAEEDKRFAATCDPLKRKATSILRSAGVETRAFNAAFAQLKEIQTQLRGSCPERIQIFGGFVEKILSCYNSTFLLRLSDGGNFTFQPGFTYLFRQDQPWATGEFVTGVTTRDDYCVSSMDPVIVYPSLLVTAAARRKWNESDRERLLSDRAAVRARKNAQLDARIGELDQKIAHNPNDAAAFAALGMAYLEKADYTRALEKINKSIVIEPTNAEWWNTRCYARALANRELREGLNDCNKSLQLRAGDPNTLDSRGYINFRLGQYDKAIADFDAVLEKTPLIKSVSSLYGRGLAKRQKGDSAGANEDVTKANAMKIEIEEYFGFFGIK